MASNRRCWRTACRVAKARSPEQCARPCRRAGNHRSSASSDRRRRCFSRGRNLCRNKPCSTRCASGPTTRRRALVDGAGRSPGRSRRSTAWRPATPAARSCRRRGCGAPRAGRRSCKACRWPRRRRCWNPQGPPRSARSDRNRAGPRTGMCCRRRRCGKHPCRHTMNARNWPRRYRPTACRDDRDQPRSRRSRWSARDPTAA